MKILILFILFTFPLTAQRLGFSILVAAPITNERIDLGPGISLAADYNILPDFYIEGKAGYVISFLYGGWDFFVGADYKIFNPVYVLAGILHHSNSGWSSISEGTRTKGITMIGLGSGIDLTSVFSIELVYYRLLKPEFWYSSRNFLDEIHKEYLNSIIKLNFRFLWSL